MTPAEKKAETAKDVEEELKKKNRELGAVEQDRRVKERMKIYQEMTLKDAEEARERDRKETQRKLERMERAELGEEEDIAVIEDNDFVIQGPNAKEWEEMRTSGWDGQAKKFVDVRIKDAQKEFNASGDARKVVLSSERVGGAEGGTEDPMDMEEKEEKCLSYEEEEEEEDEKEERKEQKEKEPERIQNESEKEGDEESEEEDEAKWGEIWEDMYGEGEHSIEEDANVVAKFANAGGYDIESESQNVAMVARLIRKLKSFREEREKEEEGESKKEQETKKEDKKESKEEREKRKEEEGESRRERRREKETDRKARSKSRRDTSIEKRSKRPTSRQVRDSSSAMEDE